MENAVRAAAAGPAIMDEKVVTPTESVNMADLSDDYTINNNVDYIELPPDHVAVDLSDTAGTELLRPMYHAFNDVTGQLISEDYIDSMVQHEGEHWRAAQTLGATTGRLVLKVSVAETVDNQQIFSVQPFMRTESFTTTKLGLAAITARPKTMSETDRNYLVAMGYPDIFALTKKIIEHNDASSPDDQYPLPFMFTKEQALRILF